MKKHSFVTFVAFAAILLFAITGCGTADEPTDDSADCGTCPAADTGCADTGTPGADTGTTPPADTGTAPVDSGTPATDTGTAPVDTGTAPSGTAKAVVTITASPIGGKLADHVYIDGELVKEGDLRPDKPKGVDCSKADCSKYATVYGPWKSLDCDLYSSPGALVCPVDIPSGMDIRFQGNIQRGSTVLYTCADDPGSLDPSFTQSATVDGVSKKWDLPLNETGIWKNCQVGRVSK